MSEYPGEHVRIWQQPDGMWRWEWLPRREEREKVPSVVSAKAFPEPETAQEKASGAYPGLPIQVVDKTPEEKQRSRRLLAFWALVGLLTVLLWHRRPGRDRPVMAVRLDRRPAVPAPHGRRPARTTVLQIGPWRLTRG